MKKKLIISFSGGRTSAYMTWWLMNVWEDRHNWDIIIVFANTGKEVEGTLFFVDECAAEWGINIIWVEGYPSPKGKGWAVNHKIVTYETASRKGEPFEAMIERLGIPCQTAPFCSPQLKREAIKSYLKSIGWKDYTIALGIRYDEPSRVNDVSARNKNIIYPFAHIFPVNKRRVFDWWRKQSFDLNIHADEGNCDNCWKKDFPRLVRNLIRNPKSFEWWNEMSIKYGGYNPRQEDNPAYNFFRGGKTILDIQQMALISQAELKQLSMFDVKDGCGESCEAF